MLLPFFVADASMTRSASKSWPGSLGCAQAYWSGRAVERAPHLEQRARTSEQSSCAGPCHTDLGPSLSCGYL